MFCTIYFVDIGTFFGDMIPPSPDDLVDDEEMADDVDQGERPPWVQIPTGMRCRVDFRFRMELHDRLCRLLVDEGVYPVTMGKIQANRMLTEI